MKKVTQACVLSLSALLYCVLPAPGAAAVANSSATGHVTVMEPNVMGVEGRVALTFAAVEHKDGLITGNITLQQEDTTIHARVTCLRVVANTAYLSGIIYKSDVAGTEGQTLYVSALDNGEGTNDPPDLVEAEILGLAQDCNLTIPPDVPVEKGNVQVRNAAE